MIGFSTSQETFSLEKSDRRLLLRAGKDKQSGNHKPECQMTLARGHPMKIDIGNAAKPFPLYETVAIMRCLSLKITSPEKYKALLALEPHTEERKRNGRYVLLCHSYMLHIQF